MCQTYIRLLQLILTGSSLTSCPAAWAGPLIFRYRYLNRVGGRGSAGYYYFSKSDNPYSPLGIFAVLLYSSIAYTKFCGFEK